MSMIFEVKEFSPKYVNESISLGWDFTLRLDTTTAESISSATFSIRCINASDSQVGTMLSGSASINNGIVSQRVIGGVAGNIYELSCSVNTSGNRSLIAKQNFKVI